MKLKRISLWFAGLAINMTSHFIRAFLTILVAGAMLRFVSPLTWNLAVGKLATHPEWAVLTAWLLWLRYSWGLLEQLAKGLAENTNAAARGLLEKATRRKAEALKIEEPARGKTAGLQPAAVFSEARSCR